MAGTCDICGGKTGFLNQFHCKDGVICKNCYGIVSNHYSTTIAASTLAELKRVYVRNAQPVDIGEDGFRTSKKIGTYLLLDEKNCKFCLLSNQQLTGNYARPEIFRYEQLERYTLISDPSLTLNQLSVLAEDKSGTTVIRKLAVQLHLKNAGMREMIILPKPVRASSFAFRKSLKAAMEVLEALDTIK